MTPPILLGTVALEPNRWGTVDPRRRSTIALSAWVPRIADAGFDGLEVWEDHLRDASPRELDAILDQPPGVQILNSYTNLDDADDRSRLGVASWVERSGAAAVKFNVGNDPAAEQAYGERIAAWLEALPPTVRLLCECHAGISIAEDPQVAARILSAGGPDSRVQAIVHTHESADHLRARFDAYGERITHVHVNELDHRAQAPRLDDHREHLAERADLLAGLGFDGTWTIEFVHGTLTADDRPEVLVAQAASDLSTLREVLA